MVRKTDNGTNLQSLFTPETTKFVGFGFVDDVDLVVTNNLSTGDPITTLNKLQTTLDLWETGLCTSGGVLSAKKSQWSFIDFKWNNGQWCYKSKDDLPGSLFMTDVSGKCLPLVCLEPHEVERSLGIQIAPDGKTLAELQFQKEQTLYWASQVLNGKSPQHITWINFITVLLKKVEYPLMVMTFSHSECKDILHPALNAVLPTIGINQHFPHDMVYGHSDHFGLAILHLYDSQGFYHLSALIKFCASPCLMGQLLQQSYESLQLELGLPGEKITKPYHEWSVLCMRTWLTHTWQYASDNGWCVVTGLPTLVLKCQNDQFLMEAFWKQGYQGKQLGLLNHCRIWLQIYSVVDITDGQGTHLLPSILRGESLHSTPLSNQWP